MKSEVNSAGFQEGQVMPGPCTVHGQYVFPTECQSRIPPRESALALIMDYPGAGESHHK